MRSGGIPWAREIPVGNLYIFIGFGSLWMISSSIHCLQTLAIEVQPFSLYSDLEVEVQLAVEVQPYSLHLDCGDWGPMVFDWRRKLMRRLVNPICKNPFVKRLIKKIKEDKKKIISKIMNLKSINIQNK